MRRQVAAFAAVLSVLAGVARAGPPLKIESRGPSEVLIGLPIDVEVTATALEADGLGTNFSLWIERNGQWVLHREADWSLGCGVRGGLVGGSAAGQSFRTPLRVHLQSEEFYRRARLALSSPGIYRLRVTYDVKTDARSHPDEALVGSSEIAVRVRLPDGPDGAVFENEVRSRPELLDPHLGEIVDPGGQLRASLVATHPRSVYAPLWSQRQK